MCPLPHITVIFEVTLQVVLLQCYHIENYVGEFWTELQMFAGIRFTVKY